MHVFLKTFSKVSLKGIFKTLLKNSDKITHTPNIKTAKISGEMKINNPPNINKLGNFFRQIYFPHDLASTNVAGQMHVITVIWKLLLQMCSNLELHTYLNEYKNICSEYWTKQVKNFLHLATEFGILFGSE